MGVIDFHTHIFSPEIIARRGEYLQDRHFSLLYGDPVSRMADNVTLLKAMNASSVDLSVIMGFPWTSEKFCEAQNSFYSTLHGLSLSRLFPYGSVPVIKGIDTDSWTREIRKLGLYGVGEVAFYTGGMTGDAISFLESLLDSSARHGLPVCLHVNEPIGHLYPGKYDPGFDRLFSVIKNQPDATIILAHWGGGLFFYELMPEVRSAFARVFYDTAASPFLYDERIFATACGITGPDKILFGSDFPLIQPTRYLESIRRVLYSSHDIERVCFLNAKGILGITEDNGRAPGA
jgi:uncharacterized protein